MVSTHFKNKLQLPNTTRRGRWKEIIPFNNIGPFRFQWISSLQHKHTRSTLPIIPRHRAPTNWFHFAPLTATAFSSAPNSQMSFPFLYFHLKKPPPQNDFVPHSGYHLGIAHVRRIFQSPSSLDASCWDDATLQRPPMHWTLVPLTFTLQLKVIVVECGYSYGFPIALNLHKHLPSDEREPDCSSHNISTSDDAATVSVRARSALGSLCMSVSALGNEAFPFHLVLILTSVVEPYHVISPSLTTNRYGRLSVPTNILVPNPDCRSSADIPHILPLPSTLWNWRRGCCCRWSTQFKAIVWKQRISIFRRRTSNSIWWRIVSVCNWIGINCPVILISWMWFRKPWGSFAKPFDYMVT